MSSLGHGEKSGTFEICWVFCSAKISMSLDSNRLFSSVAFVLVLLVAIPRVIICLCHPYKMNYLLFAYLLPRDLYSWCSGRIFSALMWVFVILSGHDSFLDALNWNPFHDVMRAASFVVGTWKEKRARFRNDHGNGNATNQLWRHWLN